MSLKAIFVLSRWIRTNPSLLKKAEDFLNWTIGDQKLEVLLDQLEDDCIFEIEAEELREK